MPVPRRYRRLPAALALLVVTISGMFPSGYPAAAIYAWTDEHGKKHYSDAPPRQRKADELKFQLRSLQGPATVTRAPEPQAAPRPRVRLFSAAWCGYCRRAKAHFAQRGIPYEDLDVERNGAAGREFAQLGGRGVPLILVGDQRMDGYDPGGLEAMLKRGGYP
ncbi:MAG: glutaredoxin family protein [Burkholderiales bacterium]